MRLKRGDKLYTLREVVEGLVITVLTGLIIAVLIFLIIDIVRRG